ncbi:unnamed protein product [Onchocerca flexuosa]|uniref:MFS domain-containing protein n=1 Tax=Onchocerca flexuosa TaxID=387005 RepID=A0A183HUX7_9BILA|nr:unnamed protein product [Onchocerca flexuosa]
MAVASAAIGGSFQFGYHIGCVNVPAKIIKLWMIDSHKKLFGETLTLDEIGRCVRQTIFNWNYILKSFRAIAVGIFAVGGMIGGLGSGKMADWLGRKGAMIFNNVVAILAAVLMTIAYYVNVYPLLIVGRLIIGINAG